MCFRLKMRKLGRILKDWPVCVILIFSAFSTTMFPHFLSMWKHVETNEETFLLDLYCSELSGVVGCHLLTRGGIVTQKVII